MWATACSCPSPLSGEERLFLPVCSGAALNKGRALPSPWPRGLSPLPEPGLGQLQHLAPMRSRASRPEPPCGKRGHADLHTQIRAAACGGCPHPPFQARPAQTLVSAMSCSPASSWSFTASASPSQGVELSVQFQGTGFALATSHEHKAAPSGRFLSLLPCHIPGPGHALFTPHKATN